ncbi:proline-rich receptor-like protein kinase perk4 [Quercus suber]|uniref:non-specific serine/threonine protein kinase n=1 Tax=Quercus suber TaxID=58331 RepID=A0AAW0JVN5_QUESU
MGHYDGCGKAFALTSFEKKKFDDLVDKRLEKNFDSKEMARMVSCAAKCLRLSYEERPRMSQLLSFNVQNHQNVYGI